MKTNHTIRIKLSESGEEHTIVLLPGRCIQVSVGGDGKLRIDHSSGDAYARQTRQMKLKDDELKRQKDENVRLESTIDALQREKERRMSFDECIVKVAATEYFRMLMEEQSQKIVQARTGLDLRFAPQCRLPLIKSVLKDYITSRGSDWMQNDWVVVHKVFCDLQWWKGKDKEFVAWVNENGYALTENNFKKTKRAIRMLLEQWYTVTGNDHFVQTARELYDLFAGGPTLPKAAAYEENGYIAHTELVVRIRKAQMGIRGLRRIGIRSTLRGHYRVEVGRHITPMIFAKTLAMPLQRHRIMGTIGLIDVTKPGRRRRRQTTKALRKREEEGAVDSSGPERRLLTPTHRT